MELEYDSDIIKDDTVCQDDEVVIVCSVICDENDTDAETNTVNKMTSYCHEIDGEQVMFHSDLDQLALLMKKDKVKLDFASPPAFKNNNKNGNSLLTCEVCNRQFLRRISLKYHILKHAGQRPYSCSICNKKYTLKLYLKHHMKVHAREKLPCPFCNEEFSSELDLQNHLHEHLVDRMLNTDEVEEEDNRYNEDVDDITELNKSNGILSDFSKAEDECSGIAQARSMESAAETAFFHNGYNSNHGNIWSALCINDPSSLESRDDGSFMHNVDQLFHKDNLSMTKSKLKTDSEELYQGSEDEAVNLLRELQADIDQELFDLHEVDFEETDECIQFLMSKFNKDFKHSIGMPNSINVDHTDNSLLSQDAKSNKVVDKEGGIGANVNEGKVGRRKEGGIGANVAEGKVGRRKEGGIGANFAEGKVGHRIKRLGVKSETKRKCYSKPSCSQDFSLKGKNCYKRPFSCDICAQRFYYLDGLKSHRAKHKKGNFRCDHCNMDYDFKYINYHMKLHFNKLVYCTFCFMGFQKFDKFKEHIETHTGIAKSQDTTVKKKKAPGRCFICKKVYSSMFSLRRHLETQHYGNNKKVSCPVCDKIFNSKAQMTEHMHVHANSLVLPQSSNVTLERSNPEEYKETQTGIAKSQDTTVKGKRAPGRCHICNKVFYSKFNLRRHMDSLHNGNDKKVPQSSNGTLERPNQKYIKSEPQAMFEETSSTKMETETKPDINFINIGATQNYKLKCGKCSKRFVQRKNLERHVKSIHFKGKSRCKENFDIDKYFKVVIENVESLLCDHCNKTFKSSRTLSAHLLKHYPTHTFTCEICSKTFYRRSYLQVHMHAHSDIKHFKCEICDKDYVSSDTLKAHTKAVHADDLK